MADSIDPEFARFIAAERKAQRLPASTQPSDEGLVPHSVTIDARQANVLIRVAARRAAGLFRPTKHTEVVWVDGDSELAVGIAKLSIALTKGLLRIVIPVRSDQTGSVRVEVTFAVGSPQAPAGLFAASPRQPDGPELIVATWGNALVAFAWQCLLGLVTGIAGATGKDQRGNVLVPVELSVSERTIEIVPMARHRFAGGSPLASATQRAGR